MINARLSAVKTLVAIPAFNEEPAIAAIVQKARLHIRDVMVIDDGSEDATTLRAMMAGAMVHRLKDNMGKGEALKAAFEYVLLSDYHWVITLDGNGRHDPGDIAGFVPLFETHDLILGKSGNSNLSRFVANSAVSLASRTRLHDTQTAFRAYSRRLLQNMPLHCRHDDLETEILIRSARAGYRIGYAPVRESKTLPRSRRWRRSLCFLTVLLKSLVWRNTPEARGDFS